MARLHRPLVFLTFLILAMVLAPTGEADPSHGQACLHTPFRGITETSETGETIGPVDPQDWGCVGEQGEAPGGARALGVPVPPPPSGICLQPAAPNPAAGSVRLGLTIGESRHVRLVIYGQSWRGGPREVFPVRALVDAQLQVGVHSITWDAKNDAGERVSPGVYRAVMEAGADVLCGDIEIH